jgi:hypothetical protein
MENNGKYKFYQGVYNVDISYLNTNKFEETYVYVFIQIRWKFRKGV